MSTLADSLSDDGVLVVTTPNAESRSLEARGNAWVYLGFGFHLVLFSAAGLDTLLRKAGFATVTTTTFEGPHRDERLIAVAIKREIPRTAVGAALSVRFEDDSEASELTTRYLRDLRRRFDGDRGVLWQSVSFRLVESLVASGDFAAAREVAEELDRHLVEHSFDRRTVLSELDDARRRGDRAPFYARIPTFIGGLYFLRGLIHLHFDGQLEALDDFRYAQALAEGLQGLPDPSFDELHHPSPALTASFHVGFCLIKLGRFAEAVRALRQISRIDEPLPAVFQAHVAMNLATALSAQGRSGEARDELDELMRRVEYRDLPEDVQRSLRVMVRGFAADVAPDARSEVSTLRRITTAVSNVVAARKRRVGRNER